MPKETATVDQQFMRRALTLAARGSGWTSPNPMVGAVVVKDGKVVGEGYHRAAGGPHAEVYALRAAGPQAAGATLYVTLEPCNHFGRTPPCTEAVLQAGIAHVVVGMADPNPHVTGSGCERLRAEGLRVDCGILERECRILNQPFIKFVTTGLPYVVMKAAATLDGRIATRTGDARWVTNDRSRRFGHRLRRNLDAIGVGIGTVLADDPLLTARLGNRKCRQPIRVVLDTRLRFPGDSQLAATAQDIPVWVFCSERADEVKAAILEQSGVKVVRVAEKRGRVDPMAVLVELAKRRVTSVLLEGGAQVLGSFLDAALVDQAYFFLAPKILGDSSGIPMVTGRSVKRMRDAMAVHDLKIRRFDQDLLLTGRLRSELY